MGLFSNPFKSKTETYVATQVSRVVEDASIQGTTQSATIKAIFNDGSIPDYLLEDLIAGIGSKAEKMYRYARDNYTYGLPSGELYSATQGRAQAEATIEAFEGQQVFIEYSYFGAPNLLHIGWKKLVENYAYNTNTNEIASLTTTKGTTVWLKDMVVVVPTSQYQQLDVLQLEQWGIAARSGYTPERLVNAANFMELIEPSPLVVSNTASQPYLLVSYVWQTTVNGVLQLNESSFNIVVSDYVFTDDYFQVKYKKGTVTKYWMYKNKSGTYPALDAVFVDGTAQAGSYFPFTYFRFGKASTTSDITSAAYQTSAKMLKILGMDYAAVANGINQNPSIADVEQAMMIFAVPDTSTNQVECMYLFDYFDNLYDVYGSGSSQILDTATHKLVKLSGVNGRSNIAHTQVIKDKKFKMAFTVGPIYKRVVAGSIGAVGTYQSLLTTENVSQSFSDGEGGTYISSVPITVNKYRHQIMDGAYEEIVVTDLKMTYYIYGNYTTTGDDASAILLVPLDRAITQHYSLPEREELYARSLHFVFNSVTTVTIKWYQSGWFKTFMIVLAIYITVQSGGSDGGKAMAAALGLQGAAATIAIVMFDLIVMGAVYSGVFRLFVKMLGKDVAQLVAIAAMVYAGYQVSANGIKGAPYAGDLLILSNGLQSAVIRANLGDLLEEQKSFESFAKEESDRLENAQKLLETKSVLNPMVIFGEKPEEYFNRTVHYGNIGTLGITAISSFVDMALTLPKVHDSLGEPLNG